MYAHCALDWLLLLGLHYMCTLFTRSMKCKLFGERNLLIFMCNCSQIVRIWFSWLIQVRLYSNKLTLTMLHAYIIRFDKNLWLWLYMHHAVLQYADTEERCLYYSCTCAGPCTASGKDACAVTYQRN